MPTGGVDLDNVADWIKACAVAVGAGGSLTRALRPGIMMPLSKQPNNLLQK